MSLIERLLTVSFTLSTGTFQESGTNTLTVSGLRTSARINKAGTPNYSSLDLAIWGLTLSEMNQLSTLGMYINSQNVPKDTIAVRAGDSKTMSTAFIGTIANCYLDAASAPDVPLRIQAFTGMAENAAPAASTTFNGPVDVAVVMKALADQMGLGFENNGIHRTLTNPYLWGSAWQQADQAAEATGILWNIVDDRGSPTLAIWPRGGFRGFAQGLGIAGGAGNFPNRATSTSIPVIAPPPDGGMIGYPTFSRFGLSVRTEYSPALAQGFVVQVKSSLSPANKRWSIYSLDHWLESKMPNGKWESIVGCYDSEQGPPPVI